MSAIINNVITNNQIIYKDVLSENTLLIAKYSTDLFKMNDTTVNLVVKFSNEVLQEIAQNSLLPVHWLQIDTYLSRAATGMEHEVEWVQRGMANPKSIAALPNANRVNIKLNFSSGQITVKRNEIASVARFREMNLTIAGKICKLGTAAHTLNSIWHRLNEKARNELLGYGLNNRLSYVYQDAQEAMKELVHVANWTHFMWSGESAVNEGRYFDAVEVLNQALDYSLQDPLFLFSRASVNFAQGRFHAAQVDFHSALERHPNQGKVHSFIGMCHLNLKNYQKAVASFNSAKDPNNAKLCYYRGCALLNLREIDKAVDDLKSARRFNKDGNFIFPIIAALREAELMQKQNADDKENIKIGNISVNKDSNPKQITGQKRKRSSEEV